MEENEKKQKDENLTSENEQQEKENEEVNDKSSEKEENHEEEMDEVEKLKKELKEKDDKYLRLQAEFRNYKKRVKKEKKELTKYAHGEIVKDILPVIDNFNRAIVSSEGDDDKESLLEGIKLIKKSLDNFLEEANVKPIKSLGEKFDPNLHHAVMKEETDEYEHNEIMEELQTGYKLEDKVIRHAMVKVASNK
ncbi:MAG: nucleotide exchange factor GrpE [Bacillota bacterium]